jgi:hypothetical protein
MTEKTTPPETMKHFLEYKKKRAKFKVSKQQCPPIQ